MDAVFIESMISQFSNNGEGYRRLMNSIIDGFVYVIIIVIAIFMLLYSKKYQKAANFNE